MEKENISSSNLIQKIFMTIFSTTYKLTSKIEEKHRSTIIFLSFFVYSGLLMFYRSTDSSKWFNGTEKELIFIIGMLIVAVFSVKGELKPITWSHLIKIPYYTLGILMLISTFIYDNETDYQLFIISILLVFPGVIFVWNNRGDYETLFNIICKAFCYSGLFLMLIALIFYPPDLTIPIFQNTYSAYAKNQNGFAVGLLTIGISAVYLLLSNNKTKVQFIAYITFFLAFTLNILTGCRTTAIAFIVLVLMYVIIKFIRYGYDEKYVAPSTSLTALKKRKKIAKISLSFIGIGGIATIIATSYFLIQLYLNLSATALFEQLNVISTGRLKIWAHYLQNSTWFGNNVGNSVNVEGRAFVGAHNSLIEFIYRSGWLVGIAYIWFWITSIIVLIKTYISTKSNNLIFALITIPCFVVTTSLETSYTSAYVGLVTFAYISLASIFIRKQSTSTNDNQR